MPSADTAISIRRATVADVPTIGRLINDCAEFGLMLPKPLATLYENIREFQVAESDDRVVGVCGLSIIWADLGEVVSLAVAPEARGAGLGKRLVRACLDEARALGIRKIMSLTYEQRFFEKLGFTVVDRAKLPHKVWAECVRCPKHDACDEIAMMCVLEDVPPAPGSPAPPPPGRYDVPVVLTTSKTGPRHSD